eukprot:GEMP01043197.1.p1 GENE.GEMP01043197.1~~GEMP01043197.1.p1  ORF type:complete len:436 (+),score=130.18 GEMP01043197.1:22-1329(+)
MGRRRFSKDPSAVRHYRLVHTSMHDDETEAPMTLQPIQPLNTSRKRDDIDEDPYNLTATKSHCMPEITEGDETHVDNEADLLDAIELMDDDEQIEERLAELDDDCYFPKDGYDYSKHLKKINAKAVMKAEVESEITEKAPMTKDECEALEALNAVANDDEAGFEEFDDDFFAELGADKVDDVDMWGKKGAELAQLNRMLDERRAMFARNFDATSIAYTETVDPRFDRVMESYGDEDIGDLEDEEVQGQLELDDIEDILDDYLEGKVEEAEENLQEIFGKNEEVVDRLSPEENMAFLDLVDELPNLSDEEEPHEPAPRWDCETILTTRSNISNHPGKIVLEKRQKTKVKKPQLEEVAEDDEEEEDILELPEVQLTRPKDETADEKRARKHAVKERQRLCRQMKKTNTLLYRMEDLKLREREVGRGDVRFKARVIPI